MRIGTGELPVLATRLLGYQPDDGYVAFLAASDYGIEHVGALGPDFEPNVSELVDRLHPSVDTIYLVGYGAEGAELARQWQRVMLDGPVPIEVPATLEVVDGYWGRVGDATFSAELERPSAVVRAVAPAEPVVDRDEIVGRLEGLAAEARVSDEEAAIAADYVGRLIYKQSPVERAALAEDILVSWEAGEPIDDDIARITGRPMGATSIFCELVRDPAVLSAVIVVAAEQPNIVRSFVEAARRAHPSASIDVQAGAGAAVWATGNDSLGPVGSQAVAQWLEPVKHVSPLANAVYECALACEDPGPVVAELHATADQDMANAEKHWEQAVAPATPTSAPPISQTRPVVSGVTPHTGPSPTHGPEF
ncbi:hypothetical protein HF995_13495 [Sanguibacter hominis ATCC BAA-789]|uniref:Uncharacterized protein n=1 Tax=Sanguibacter hominis ATCC BAA-789 TaxID=1312740 RepID=A0A9X5FDF8_9MICO|nr:hypothetical protein [Sanguibacter hominis]NKX94270.1 hypothetical protein [Sanguibacter hominis ATCC BAA-789]